MPCARKPQNPALNYDFSTLQILKIAVAAGLICLVAPPARGDERAELRAIELQLEEVKRRVPPEFDSEAEERFIRGMAKVAEVPIEVRVTDGRVDVDID